MYVKGLLDPEDAVRAVAIGCEGVVVSNHGGRQLDHSLAALDALPPIVAAVGDRAEVLLDGGVRRGTDVVKALALGARAVLIGGPQIYGLIVGGEQGVVDVLEIFRAEIDRALTLMGAESVHELDRSWVIPRITPRAVGSGQRHRARTDDDQGRLTVADGHVSEALDVLLDEGAGLTRALLGNRPGRRRGPGHAGAAGPSGRESVRVRAARPAPHVPVAAAGLSPRARAPAPPGGGAGATGVPRWTSRRVIARNATRQKITTVSASATVPSPSPSPPTLFGLPIQSANDAPSGRVATYANQKHRIGFQRSRQ